MSAHRGHAASVEPLLHAVSHRLHATLRGGGAVIEGVEFWGTHPSLVPRHVGHFLVAAGCTLVMTRLVAGIEAVLPNASALAWPWYLVVIEWAWSHFPSALAAALSAWGVETAYLGLVSLRAVIDAVASRRGGASNRAVRVSPRGVTAAWLLLGGLVCAGLAYVPIIGPPVSLALMCPVLGAGFIVATLAARGSGAREIAGFVRSRIAMVAGLGGGVLVALAIPVIGLVALPCAAAGTVCLVLREERAASVRTSAETVPYASPSR